METKRKDYKKLMEKIIELERTHDFHPHNMWSYSGYKKYIISNRVNKLYAKLYKELKNELKKAFYNDKELYPKIKKMPYIYILVNNRFEIICLIIGIIAFFITIVFKLETGIVIPLSRSKDGTCDIIIPILLVSFWGIYFFFVSKLNKKKQYVEMIMSEIKRIIEKRAK